MPEIGEGWINVRAQHFTIDIALVARVVHFVRTHLVGKTLASVTAQDDANVFGKVGTTAQEFEKALTGKTIVDAGQQGKYFWYVSIFEVKMMHLRISRFIMSSPPHPLFRKSDEHQATSFCDY